MQSEIEPIMQETAYLKIIQTFRQYHQLFGEYCKISACSLQAFLV